MQILVLLWAINVEAQESIAVFDGAISKIMEGNEITNELSIHSMETYHKTFQNENYLCVAYCAYLNAYKKNSSIYTQNELRMPDKRYYQTNVLIFDNKGKEIQNVKLNNINCQEIVSSIDGRYIALTFGDVYDGGEYIHPGHIIYDTLCKEIIVNNGEWGHLSILHNMIFIGNFIYDLEKREKYTIKLSDDQVKQIKSYERQGIILKDGSMLIYEKKFPTNTF
ncbi:MAG: hypothetical protein R2798_07760 [Chitinophagales bacterium]|nr:hypothetical protein [Bacteroidota bacterium]MCB9042331.1 hypothetical protein [Chitinophagales bacterium]